jgi:hypothetical protein
VRHTSLKRKKEKKEKERGTTSVLCHQTVKEEKEGEVF